MKRILVVLTGLILSTALFAQEFDTTEFVTPSKSKIENTTANTQNTNAQVQELLPISSWEFYLSLVVLGFGALVLALEVFLIWKRKISEDNTVKFIVVTLIITSMLFLITAGYDNNQIAPAMGLLGTIAGYLLGKQEKEKTEKKEEKTIPKDKKDEE